MRLVVGLSIALLSSSAMSQPHPPATASAAKAAPAAASATNPQYLEALRDLRAAQAGIKGRKDKTPVSPYEGKALEFVGTAIWIIQRDTNFKDGGATTADIQVSAAEGRLHDVDAYLSKARSDLQAIPGKDKMRSNCIAEIDSAQLEVGRALKDYARQTKPDVKH